MERFNRGIIIVFLLALWPNVYGQVNSAIIVKGDDKSEKSEYVISRYLFNTATKIRSQVYDEVSSQDLSNDAFQLLAFQCFDSIQNINFTAADSLIDYLRPIATKNYKALVIEYLQANYAIKTRDTEYDFSMVENLLYPPVSFKDSTLCYYTSILLCKTSELSYDRKNFLKWNLQAFNYKTSVLKEELNYSDYRRLAMAYDKNDFLDSAFYYYNQSLIIAESQNDSVGLFMANMDLGIFYSERGARSTALEYFLECGNYVKSVSLRNQAAFHINCNIDYRNVGRQEVARDHLVRAEEIAFEIQDTLLLGHVYQNWVAQYGQENKLDSIPSVLKISEGFLKASNNTYGLGHLYLDIGTYYSTKGNLDSALYWYGEGEECFTEIGNLANVHTSKEKQFYAYMDFKKYVIAKPLGLDLLKGAAIYNDAEDSMDVQFGLAEIFELEGNDSEALQFYKRATKIKNKIEGIEATRKVNILRIKAEQAEYYKLELKAEQNRQKLLKSNAELESQRKTNLYLSLLAIGTIILLVVILYFSFKIRKTNERLRKLDEEKDNLMQVVAHDLLAPIGKVGALTELLKMAETEKEKEEYLEFLGSVVEDSSVMIQNLMDMHAFENNRIGHMQKMVLISDLVEDSLIGIKLKAATKQIQLIEKIEQNTSVLIDGRLLKRVLENLVSNAVKFSKPESRVYVTALVDSSNLKLEITDEGPGFSEEDKKKVFGRFTKLSARPTANEGSSGLGLAIVKELVKQMGGQIKLESELGKGAKFTVVIPIK